MPQTGDATAGQGAACRSAASEKDPASAAQGQEMPIVIITPVAQPGGAGGTLTNTVGDLAALKARIARDLNRTDLTTQIADEISSAIAYYRSHRFEFNEIQATFSTVAFQDEYAIASMGQPDTLRIT